MKTFGAFATALLTRTLLSFAWLAFLSDGNVCSILQAVPPGGSHATNRSLTQAAMDAQIASRCGTPTPNQLLAVAAGYLVIVVPLLYVAAREHQRSAEP